jgi:hypothetical protein
MNLADMAACTWAMYCSPCSEVPAEFDYLCAQSANAGIAYGLQAA